MHFVSLLAIAAAIVPGAVADCRRNGKHCQWFGSSPACGSSSSKFGDIDREGRKYIASTKEFNYGQICNESPDQRPDGEFDGEYPGQACCDDYGAGCVSGYKRLWCYES